MTGRVELDVRLRLDPSEHDDLAVTETIGGTPLVIVRDLITVDELAVGHVVCMLLVTATEDAS